MCGITGIIDRGNPSLPSLIGKMTDALRHRGPDDEGFILTDQNFRNSYACSGPDTVIPLPSLLENSYTPGLALGHRRLSILDTTTAGHQPMLSKDQRYWLVFNGEIYNYLELRSELQTKGFTFKTGTDTEVLLAAYQQWGEKCLEYFNGMFSFVIFDQEKLSLFGARDRTGVKPFYYTRQGVEFAFASEIRALRELPGCGETLNPLAVMDYLGLGWLEADPEGFYLGIHELPPAHCFTYDLPSGTLDVRRWFDLEFSQQWDDFSEKKLAEHASRVRELLFNALRMRMRSDVPLGSCLSGGLDSSAIVCMVNQLLGSVSANTTVPNQKVFTATFPDTPIDETAWAEMVVKQTGAEWFTTTPKAEELADDLIDLVRTQEIPFNSTSIYAQYRVMKRAKEAGVTVLLDGQGGDELFAGYALYHRAFFSEMIDGWHVKDLLRESCNLKNAAVGSKTLVNGLLNHYGRRFLPESIIHSLLAARRPENSYLSGTAEMFNGFQKRVGDAGENLNQVLSHYISGIYLKSLLRYEDRNSMRFSIESRTPFADDIHLINYLFSLSAVWKIRNGVNKILLRKSVGDLLPPKILARRDKLGFAIPETEWLKKAGPKIREYITDDLSEYLNVTRIQKDWDKILAGGSDCSTTFLWRLINFAVFKHVSGVKN